VRVFQTRAFAQFCRKSNIAEGDLCALVDAMVLGAIDADLGGGVYKQRLRRRGQGKSGGYRTIVLVRFGQIAMFTYGFAKNERDNIDRTELMRFRKFAKEVFDYDDEELKKLANAGAIFEICLEH
jgi:hypothetical protein